MVKYEKCQKCGKEAVHLAMANHLNFIREQDDYIVNIIKTSGNGWSREARGYNLYRLPSGMVRVYKSFTDDYSCYLPKYVYNKYLPIREAYLDIAIETMSKMKDRIGRPKKDSDDT